MVQRCRLKRNSSYKGADSYILLSRLLVMKGQLGVSYSLQLFNISQAKIISTIFSIHFRIRWLNGPVIVSGPSLSGYFFFFFAMKSGLTLVQSFLFLQNQLHIQPCLSEIKFLWATPLSKAQTFSSDCDRHLYSRFLQKNPLFTKFTYQLRLLTGPYPNPLVSLIIDSFKYINKRSGSKHTGSQAETMTRKQLNTSLAPQAALNSSSADIFSCSLAC